MRMASVGFVVIGRGSIVLFRVDILDCVWFVRDGSRVVRFVLREWNVCRSYAKLELIYRICIGLIRKKWVAGSSRVR